MTDKKREKETEVTPKGAVEVDEQDLDQAAGGVLIGLSQPADSFSLNYSKIDVSGQKVSPTLVTGAGPGAGPHVVPEKKI